MGRPKGGVPWNKGLKMWENKQHPRGTLGMVGLNKGIKRTEQTKKKMSEAHLGKPQPWNAGSKSHFWRGGVSPKNENLRKSLEYRAWRRKVFERDDYICQICKARGVPIHADHIKPFAHFEELRFDVDNGRTLCIECHKKTDTYGGKSKRLSLKVE